MTREAPTHQRRSLRLRAYDYTGAGAYFVTICTQRHACLFGRILEGEMHLNDAGRMIQTVWAEIPAFYPGVDVDQFAVMPNHVHGIIVLAGGTPDGRTRDRGVACDGQARGPAPTGIGGDAGGAVLRNGAAISVPVGAAPRGRPMDGGATEKARPMSLADVVHRFKTMTTRRYADGVKHRGWPAFAGRLWQRNYYEHVIRDDDPLDRIRQYILDNPTQWAADRENPAATEPRSKEPWAR